MFVTDSANILILRDLVIQRLSKIVYYTRYLLIQNLLTSSAFDVSVLSAG